MEDLRKWMRQSSHGLGEGLHARKNLREMIRQEELDWVRRYGHKVRYSNGMSMPRWFYRKESEDAAAAASEVGGGEIDGQTSGDEGNIVVESAQG